MRDRAVRGCKLRRRPSSRAEPYVQARSGDAWPSTSALDPAGRAGIVVALRYHPYMGKSGWRA